MRCAVRVAATLKLVPTESGANVLAVEPRGDFVFECAVHGGEGTAVE